MNATSGCEKPLDDPVPGSLLRDAVSVSVRPLVVGSVVEEAGQGDPIWDDWDAFARKHASQVKRIERALRREVLVHFKTASLVAWRIENFSEPFESVESAARHQRAFSPVHQYAQTWTGKELRLLLFRSFRRNMQILRSLETFLSNWPEDKQCEHIWGFQDATASLVKLGDLVTSPDTPDLLEKSRATLYGTLIMEELWEDNLEFDQVFRLKRAIDDVLATNPPRRGGQATPARG